MTQLGGITLSQIALGNEIAAEAGIQALETALESDAMERALQLLILCRVLQEKQDAAIALLEQAVSKRLPLLMYIFQDPMLKSLRTLPRFQALQKQVIGEPINIKPNKRKYKKTLFTTE